MHDKVNLLPLEIKQKRKTAKRNAFIFLGACVYVVIIIAYFIGMSFLIDSARNDLAKVKQDRAMLRTKISQYSLFEKREKELDKRKELVNVAKQGEIRWSRIIYKLSLLLPPQVWLSSFKADGQNLVISGNSFDLQGVSGTILQILNIEELTDRVVLKNIKKDEETQTMIFNINSVLPQEDEKSKDNTSKQQSSGQ